MFFFQCFFLSTVISADMEASFLRSEVILTQQLLILQALASSLQVVFAKGVGAEEVTQARRRQLLLQEANQLFGHVSRDRQTNQR